MFGGNLHSGSADRLFRVRPLGLNALSAGGARWKEQICFYRQAGGNLRIR